MIPADYASSELAGAQGFDDSGIENGLTRTSFAKQLQHLLEQLSDVRRQGHQHD
jgi:hypothetical protein